MMADTYPKLPPHRGNLTGGWTPQIETTRCRDGCRQGPDISQHEAERTFEPWIVALGYDVS
jgi:hypothetical protein